MESKHRGGRRSHTVRSEGVVVDVGGIKTNSEATLGGNDEGGSGLVGLLNGTIFVANVIGGNAAFASSGVTRSSDGVAAEVEDVATEKSESEQNNAWE